MYIIPKKKGRSIDEAFRWWQRIEDEQVLRWGHL